MGRGDTFINALIGVVVSIITSFTGFGPLIGGAVAGYLQQEDSSAALRVGALVGVITLIPLVLFTFLLGGILPFVPSFAAVAGVFFVVILFFVAVYTVGLAALGGYVGWYVWKEDVL